jgi:hypothetical protein
MTQDGTPSPSPLSGIQRIRAWLKSDMRAMRWVFLVLYLLLLIAPLVAFVTEGDDAIPLAVLLAVMLAAQALFIFGSGTMHLCRPMRKRRLIWPVLVASFMMALLLFGLLLAAGEFFRLDGNDAAGILLVTLGGLSWGVWGWFFWHRYRYRHRYTVMSRLTTWLLSGSLLELIACVPMHIVVSRRPGCLVGLATMLGIIAGCLVAVFAFGPAIILLFLRPRHREELAAAARGERYCDVCGYDLRASVSRCPECGTTFSLPGGTGESAAG